MRWNYRRGRSDMREFQKFLQRSFCLLSPDDGRVLKRARHLRRSSMGPHLSVGLVLGASLRTRLLPSQLLGVHLSRLPSPQRVRRPLSFRQVHSAHQSYHQRFTPHRGMLFWPRICQVTQSGAERSQSSHADCLKWWQLMRQGRLPADCVLGIDLTRTRNV